MKSETAPTFSEPAANAERAVLGALLLDNATFSDLASLPPEAFEIPRHGIIFRTLRTLIDSDGAADIVTLTELLREKRKLKQAGGEAYVAGLTSEPGALGNVKHYADIILEAHRRRETQRNLTTALERLKDGAGVDEVLTSLTPVEVPATRRIFTRLGMIELSTPKWTVQGVFERATQASIFGAPESFKSFLAADLSACVVTGSPWRGRDTAQGPVFYIAGEGYQGLKRRFTAWEIRHGIPLDDAPIYLSAAPVAFGDPGALSRVRTEIDNVVQTEGAPRLIVIDTLNRNYAGNENDSSDMGAFIGALDELRVRYEALILTTHHSGHSSPERSRGHSAFKAALDWEYKCERDGDSLRVTCTKSKDFEAPEPMQFTFRQVELGMIDEDGEEITSGILDPVDFEAKKGGGEAAGKWQKLALSVLKTETDRHVQNVESSGRDASEAHVSVDAWRAACTVAGVPREPFYPAKEALKKKGIISISGEFVQLVRA